MMKWMYIVCLFGLAALGQDAAPNVADLVQRLNEADETIQRLRQGSDADLEKFKREAAVREKAIGRKLIKEVNDRLAAEKKMRDTEKKVNELLMKQEEIEIRHRAEIDMAGQQIAALTNELAQVRKVLDNAPPASTNGAMARTQLAGLQKQVAELMGQITTLEAEGIENRKKIEQLTAMADENRKLADDLAMVRKSLDDTDQKMTAQNKLLDALQQENTSLSEENETLTKSTQELSQKNQSLLAQNSELEAMQGAPESKLVEVLKQQQQELVRTNGDLERKFADQLGRVQRLNRELTLRKQQIANLEEMKSTPAGVSPDALAKFEAELKLRDSTIAELGQKAAMSERLDVVNQQLQADVMNMAGMLREEEERRNEMNSQLTTLARDLAQVQSRLLDEQLNVKTIEDKQLALQALASSQAQDMARVIEERQSLQQTNNVLLAELERATQQANQLTADLTATRTQMQANPAPGEMDALKKRMADLESQADTRAKALDAQIQELKNTLSNKDKRIESLSETASQAEKLQDANRKLSEEIARVKQAGMQDQTQLAKDFDSATQKLEANDAELMALKGQISALEKRILTSEQERELASKALDAATRKWESAELRIASIRTGSTSQVSSDVARLKDDMDAATRGLNAEVDTLKKQVANRDMKLKDMAATTQKATRLEQANRQLSLEVKALSSKLSGSAENHEMALEQLDFISKDLSETGQKLGTLQASMADLQAELFYAQKQVKLADVEKNALTESNQVLLANLERATLQANQLTADLAATRTQMQGRPTPQNLDALKKQMADLERQAGTRAKALDAQIQELKKTVSSKDKRIASLSETATQAEKLQNANRKLSQEIARVKQAGMQGETKLVKDFESATKKLEANDAELLTLKGQISVLEKRILTSDLERELASKALDAATRKWESAELRIASIRTGTTAQVNADVARLKADMDKATGELNAKVETLNKQVANRDMKLKDMAATSQKATRLEQANQKLSVDVKALSSALASSTADHEYALKQLDVIAKDLSETGQKLGTLQASMAEVQARLFASEKQVRLADAEMNLLTESNEVLFAEVQRLLPFYDQLADVSSQLTATKEELAAAKVDADRVPGLEAKFKSLETSVAKTSTDLTAQITSLQSDLKQRNQSIVSLEKTAKEATRLKLMNTALRTQIEDVNNGVEGIAQERRDFKKRLAGVMSSLADIGKKLTDVEKDLSIEKAARQKDLAARKTAEAQLASQSALARSEKAKNERLVEDVRQLQLQRKSLANQYMILSNNLVRAQSNLRLAQKDMQKAQADRAVQTVLAERLSSEKADLKESLAQTEQALDATEVNLKELNKRALSMAQEFANMGQAYSNQVNDYNQTLELLASVSNKLNETSEDLQVSADNLEKTRNDLAKREKALDLKTKDLAAAEKAAMAMRKTMEAEIATQKKSIQTLTQNLRQRSQELADSKTSVEELTKQGQMLTKRLEEESVKLVAETKRADLAEGQRETLLKEQKVLEKNIAKLNQTLGQTKKKLADTEKRRITLNEQLAAVRETNKILEFANQSLRATNFVQQAGLERSSRAITRISEELAETGMTLDDVTAERDLLATREADLLGAKQDLERKLALRSDEVAELNVKVANQSRDLSDMSSELASQIEARDVLADQLVSTADTLRDTRKSIEDNAKVYAQKTRADASKRTELGRTIAERDAALVARDKATDELKTQHAATLKLRDDSIATLKGDMAKLGEERDGLVTQLSKVNGQLAAAKKVISTREASIASLTRETTELALSLGKASMDLTLKDQKMAELNAEITGAVATNEELDGALSKTQAQFEQSMKEVASLETRRAELQADIKTLDGDLAAKTKQAQSLTKTVGQRDQTLQQRNAELAELRKDLRAREREIGALVDASDRQRADIAKLEAAGVVYVTKINALESSLADSTNELNVTEGLLAAKEKELKTTIGQRGVINQTAARIKSELEKEKKRADDLDKRLVAQVKEVTQLKGEIAFLETATASVNRLQKRLEDAQRAAVVLQEEKTRQEVAIIEAQAEQEALRKTNDLERAKVLALGEELSTLKRDMVIAEKRHQTLLADIDAQKAALVTAEELRTDMVEELTQTREKLAASEFKMTQLVSQQQKMLARMRGLLGGGTMSN